uniref:Uncharacterized protein n=1 Tax=Chromera velia CCMP2878 TaxID=1169474 RepID=A0A0G4HCA3_9ALVE|mmetsp:Transcript_25433/g.49706  ORF Transcript_25433/g.49706 Transcript_25433/m.49706 type:complete len:491 (+) Transcript_25433:159-1631(+)|eukprot:Cvel_26158.t1-p1 / transcript=Cvel_26158.t1 / gene=Cvel_26158 / organism=Chromera_velia_CCMP2878 / gene_product=Probable mannosyltransferase KTR4, putative / transcript_product=Probable mannosyltransferase KTR4, putative / location=Cvel_scaffold3069:14244-16116(+) / protein_length=490 / sequence_SO=supercontig / SO=protein_coding / is_pseudo=false
MVTVWKKPPALRQYGQPSAGVAVVVVLFFLLTTSGVFLLTYASVSHSTLPSETTETGDLNAAITTFAVEGDPLNALISLEWAFNAQRQNRYPYVVFHAEGSMGAVQKDWLRHQLKRARSDGDGIEMAEATEVPPLIEFVSLQTKSAVSGFSWDQILEHPSLLDYRYIWKVEGEGTFFCKMDSSALQKMASGGTKYGWTMSRYENEMDDDTWQSVEKLWKAVVQYGKMKVDEGELPRDHLSRLLKNRGTLWGGVTRCRYDSGVELFDTEFFRSPRWRNFSSFVEEKFEADGGIPPSVYPVVRTLGTDLLLNETEVLQVVSIGFETNGICRSHCPLGGGEPAAEASPNLHGDLFRPAQCRSVVSGDAQGYGACAPFVCKVCASAGRSKTGLIWCLSFLSVVICVPLCSLLLVGWLVFRHILMLALVKDEPDPPGELHRGGSDGGSMKVPTGKGMYKHEVSPRARFVSERTRAPASFLGRSPSLHGGGWGTQA